MENELTSMRNSAKNDGKWALRRRAMGSVSHTKIEAKMPESLALSGAANGFFFPGMDEGSDLCFRRLSLAKACHGGPLGPGTKAHNVCKGY